MHDPRKEAGELPTAAAPQLPRATLILRHLLSSLQIWVGGRGLSQGQTKGKIYVIDAERKTVEKELVAHADAVQTLCSAEDRYVLSGSGAQEGKIAIWKVE